MQVIADQVAFAHPGGRDLFTDLSFTATAGDLVAVIGPSGSGKSTLLSILGGWLHPTQGSFTVQGAGRVALVPQNPYGVAGRTAVDHVSLPLVADGRPRREAEQRAHALLTLLRLDYAASRAYRTLSGGERQRMLLARALASDPGLLLVDEPTAQLDAASTQEVCDALSVLGGTGVLIFVATHDHRVVEACTRTLDLLTAAPAGPSERERHADANP